MRIAPICWASALPPPLARLLCGGGGGDSGGVVGLALAAGALGGTEAKMPPGVLPLSEEGSTWRRGKRGIYKDIAYPLRPADPEISFFLAHLVLLKVGQPGVRRQAGQRDALPRVRLEGARDEVHQLRRGVRRQPPVVAVLQVLQRHRQVVLVRRRLERKDAGDLRAADGRGVSWRRARHGRATLRNDDDERTMMYSTAPMLHTSTAVPS